MRYHVELQEFDETYLEKSFFWLTDMEIKALTQTPEISRESQRKWFNSLKTKEDYKVFGICVDGMGIGAIGLKNINWIDQSAEYFGYIGEKEYWGKGIGATAMELIESYAAEMHLCRLYLKVLRTNTRAIAMYIRCGYKRIDTKEEMIFMEKQMNWQKDGTTCYVKE